MKKYPRGKAKKIPTKKLLSNSLRFNEHSLNPYVHNTKRRENLKKEFVQSLGETSTVGEIRLYTEIYMLLSQIIVRERLCYTLQLFNFCFGTSISCFFDCFLTFFCDLQFRLSSDHLIPSQSLGKRPGD